MSWRGLRGRLTRLVETASASLGPPAANEGLSVAGEQTVEVESPDRSSAAVLAEVFAELSKRNVGLGGSASPAAVDAGVDVCLVLEGTYPYVRGGVSAWVHELVSALPSRTFGVVALAPVAGTYSKLAYDMPPNVRFLKDVFCHENPTRRGRVAGWGNDRIASMARALEQLHLGGNVNPSLIDVLAGPTVDPYTFLHMDAHMALARHIARCIAPREPFADLFWHLRSMHAPLLNMLATALPPARVYHACSTGYGGLLGAIASRRTGSPLLLTEHGIYTDERDLELLRTRVAPMMLAREQGESGSMERPLQAMGPEAERLWSRFFSSLAAIAYHQASRVLTVSGSGRDRVASRGCSRKKLEVVPNGVEIGHIPVVLDDDRPLSRSRKFGKGKRVFRIALVGRVVPIKDVATFIRACDLAMREIDLEAWIVGPEEEEPEYGMHCRQMAQSLRRSERIRFWGHQNVAGVYPRIGALVLTSLSEGQPLVVLEAQAMGVPVIATDVGACRELLEGGTAEDRALGPSGIVTRVSAPEETAAAIVALAKDPGLRGLMGARGRHRVSRYYARSRMLARYEELYTEVSSRPA